MNPKPLLTIGMSTYDDFDGVYFSIQAIRMYHGDIIDSLQFIVLDNHPGSKEGQATRQFIEALPAARYIPFPYYNSTSTRDVLFREAPTPYVLCMDSHVFFAPGAIAQLIRYFEEHPASTDLIHGPLVYDNLHQVSSHFIEKWNDGMYGTWGFDARAANPFSDPFEIPMQGLGVFACRKEAWLGFNPRFRGFGGEEGYIHQKYRNAGQQVLCLPFLRWMHRFVRPRGTSYPNKWKDRIRNYLIGFQEVGLDIAACKNHFRQLLGEEHYLKVEAEILQEFSSPFSYFDAIYFLPEQGLAYNTEELQKFFKTWGIEHLIQFPAVEDQVEWSREGIVQKSRKYQYQRIAILTGFLPYTEDNQQGIKERLRQQTTERWRHFYLWHRQEGGIHWEAINLYN